MNINKSILSLQVWSIVSAICCFPALGVIAVIKSMGVKHDIKTNNLQQAKEKSKKAFLYNILACIMGFVLFIVLIVAIVLIINTKCTYWNFLPIFKYSPMFSFFYLCTFCFDYKTKSYFFLKLRISIIILFFILFSFSSFVF